MNLDVEHARALGPQQAAWAFAPAAEPVTASHAARTWLTPRLAAAAFAAPGENPFLALAPRPRCHGAGVEITAVKRPEQGEGLVVRLFNRTGAAAAATVDPGPGWRDPRLVALDETTAAGSCPAETGGWASVLVPALGLATLRWSPAT
jgi:hypothetical protein